MTGISCCFSSCGNSTRSLNVQTVILTRVVLHLAPFIPTSQFAAKNRESEHARMLNKRAEFWWVGHTTTPNGSAGGQRIAPGVPRRLVRRSLARRAGGEAGLGSEHQGRPAVGRAGRRRPVHPSSPLRRETPHRGDISGSIHGNPAWLPPQTHTHTHTHTHTVYTILRSAETCSKIYHHH